MKAKLKMYCESFIDNRIKRIKDQIETISQSLQSETKSSAGDKHETGRAMLQLEREKLGVQLAEAENTKRVLSKVQPDKISAKISLGSLVKTDMHQYYIAISAGAFEIGGDIVYCISTQTPIAKLCMGKSKGESFVINGIKQEILEIV